MGCIFSPAKINLALHVVGQEANGYHRLQSLSVFADIGDTLHWRESNADSLAAIGDYAALLPHNPADNLLFKTLNLVRTRYAIPPLALTLHKNLPVAAGIGGGSGNAAALLRGLQAQYGLAWDHMTEFAAQLGADVPMCLQLKPLWANGIGDQLTPIVQWPSNLGIVLIRPPVATPTAQVFSALQHKNNPPTDQPLRFDSITTLRAFLHTCRNDLTAPAQQLVPSIKIILDCLQYSNSTVIKYGVSGSGATCFILCDTVHSARDMALKLQRQFTDYWIKVGVLL